MQLRSNDIVKVPLFSKVSDLLGFSWLLCDVIGSTMVLLDNSGKCWKMWDFYDIMGYGRSISHWDSLADNQGGRRFSTVRSYSAKTIALRIISEPQSPRRDVRIWAWTDCTTSPRMDAKLATYSPDL